MHVEACEENLDVFIHGNIFCSVVSFNNMAFFNIFHTWFQFPNSVKCSMLNETKIQFQVLNLLFKMSQPAGQNGTLLL